MYLCFEASEKRIAFREESLITFDENGFTLKSGGPRPAFFRNDSYQGCVQSFVQALNWVKRTAPRKAEPEPTPQAAETPKPIPKKPIQRPARPLPPLPSPGKLPNKPSF